MIQNQIKLPPSLENNQIAKFFVRYLSKLGKSSGFFSCILYRKENSHYFLTKDKDFPYIDFDWTIYTLLRNSAKTIITSGLTLRSQPHVYQQSRGTFGKKQIVELYQANGNHPFNLIVFTKKMNDEQVYSIIDKNYFKYIPLKDFDLQLKNGQFDFKQLAQKVNQKQLGPTIYENGQATLNKGLLEVKENQLNFVELIVLSLFQGDMPEKYIGNKYDETILKRDFHKEWESPKIHANAKHENGVEKPITLIFIIYARNKPSK